MTKDERIQWAQGELKALLVELRGYRNELHELFLEDCRTTSEQKFKYEVVYSRKEIEELYEKLSAIYNQLLPPSTISNKCNRVINIPSYDVQYACKA
jgi:hypothetical protein